MRFSILATALVSATVANAVQHLIKVGDNNGLVFNPTDITAANGDSIVFQFQSKNHSVTQSSFASPCVKLPSGVDSGFQPINQTGALPQWTITVNNASAPLWFFCAQTIPANHCATGMVFAVNAPPTKTFAQFQNAAKAGGNATTSASGSTVSSTGSAGTPGGAGAGSGSAAPAPSSSAKSGALKLGGSTAGVLTAAALFVSFVL